MAGPQLRIEPPTRTARKGGISSVAEVRSNDRIGITEDVVFQSDGCTFPQLEENRCFAVDVDDKTFDGIEIADAIGAPFTLYAGVSCHAGPDPDELARAERALEDGKDRVLEEALALWAAGGTALAAGTNPVGAVARVEQALDAGYVGQGIILMSRYDSILADAAGALQYHADGPATTINGTPVVASGSVTPGTIYGLGAIVIERSKVTAREVIEVQKNKHHALAEGQFVLAVDCEFRVKSSTGA